MVEKPPLHIYDIYLEVDANGGHGGIWRPFYLSYYSRHGANICNVCPYYRIRKNLHRQLQGKLCSFYGGG